MSWPTHCYLDCGILESIPYIQDVAILANKAQAL